MDAAELARQFQALMDAQKAPSSPQPQQPSQDVLLVSPPDAAYERLYAPEVTDTLPAYTFDDHLLEETEVAGDIKMTNSAVAAYRAKRTGYQGLLASVLIAVGGVFTSLTVGADINWTLLGLSAGQAALTALLSYLHNDKANEVTE